MRARFSFGTLATLVQLVAAASLLLLLLLLCAAPLPAAAVPFSSLSPKPELQLFQPLPGFGGRTLCVLSASGLGISSITAADVALYVGRACGSGSTTTTFNAVDLSNNSLATLPAGLFSGPPSSPLQLIDLSRNRFTAAGVANFASVLSNVLSDYGSLDVSFNDIGPAVPSALARLYIRFGALLLMACGITDVPTNAFGTQWRSIDLSLNNLRNGLHPLSFSGVFGLKRISLVNCNLRSSSLVTGVFDTAWPSSWGIVLHMDNTDAELSTMDTATLNERFPYRGLSPKLPLVDPRLLSAAEINPSGQPHTNQISVERYLASWANYFDPFPAGAISSIELLSTSSSALYLGDVVRTEVGWLGSVPFSILSLTLAPQSVVAALSSDPAAYCPLHSLMRSLSVQWGQPAPTLSNMHIFGFDLPLPVDPLPTGCALPDCTAMGGCRQLSIQQVTLSTEPAMLRRDLMRWLVTVAQPLSLLFQPPPLQLWNPALNGSDWVQEDLFCDLDLESYTLPALPYSDNSTGLHMPFPLPGGLLRCLSDDSNLKTIDWSATRLFTSEMLVNLTSTRSITLLLNIDALYGGVRPVPFGFFDPLQSQSNIAFTSKCVSSCSRISSQCPHFVDGACQSCPLGSFKRLYARGWPYNDRLAYCSPCPSGSYCDAAASLNPVPCPRGTYQQLAGQSTCVACPAGMTTTAVGATSASSCVLCPRGWFCDPNHTVPPQICPTGTEQPLLGQTSASSCALCAPGKFAGNTGTTSCVECAAGRFASDTGAVACQQCSAGRYQNATGQAACGLCSAGQFAASTATTSCVECTAGKFSTVAGAVACQLCSAGRFQTTTGQTACEPCAASSFNGETGSTSIAACGACPTGSYCALGVAAPTKCPAGFEQPLLSQSSVSSCIPCATGKSASASGTANCAGCATGRFASEEGSQWCSPCAAGRYQGVQGQTACEVCVAGRFAASGSSSCTGCAAGSFSPDEGVGSCQQCATGRYQNVMTQTECKLCSAGSANPSTGSTSSFACAPCQAGRFAALTGMSSCPECASGKYTATTGQSTCALCPSGTYSTLTGRSDPASCINCSPGRFNPSEGGGATGSCQPCPAGSAASSPGSAACVQCLPGYYQPTPGSFVCEQCPAGRYQPATGSSGTSAVCLKCPSFSPDSPAGSGSSSQCTAPVCPDGFYTAAADSTPCASRCPAGAYCQLGVATLCPIGSYNPSTGAASAAGCRACPVGHYNSGVGAASCRECAVGTYQDAMGAFSCQACAAGTYLAVTGANSSSLCVPCPPSAPDSASGSGSLVQCRSPVCPDGRYTASANDAPCSSPCPVGAFCQLGVVTLCPPATFNDAASGAGPGSCRDCPVGRASGTPGSAVCSPCAAGQYQNRTGQFQCDVCPSGTYQPETAATTNATCLVCPSGTPLSPAGSGSSLQCTALPCPDGWISQSSDPAPCSSPCPLGSWCQLGVAMACGPAHYNDQLGGRDSSACLPCPAGTSNAYPGASSCVPCSTGYWQDAEASSTCQPCPANTFQPSMRAVSADFCQPCPLNAPLSPSASGSLFQCSTGVVCAKGLFTLHGDAPCAEPCRLGSFCEGGEIAPCPAGSFADREGMSSCTPCGAGSIGSLVGSRSASDCAACPPSTYSAAPVSTACTPCPAGSFSSGSGSSSAAACVSEIKCVTAQSLAVGSRDLLDSSASLCPTGGLQPIAMSALLPGGTAHAASFMAQVGRLLRDMNTTQEAESDVTAAMTEASAQAAHAIFKPAKNLAPLRLAVVSSDATLSAFRATEAKAEDTTDHNSAGSNGGSFTLSSAATAGLIAGLLVVAFAPLVAYRLLPAKIAVVLDQFSDAHAVPVGSFFANAPTRLGAVISWSFLWVALLAAVLLGLQDNMLRTTELLPPSATSLADTAMASWQITLRAYTAEDAAAMAVWCRSSNAKLLSRQSGFNGVFTLRAEPAGQSCAVTADCATCGISALSAVSFAFPYSAQLIEWELWVNGAQPHSWARRYGLLTQLPGGRLLDAESELRFSVMESYHSDERSAAFAPGLEQADKRRSGFELNFLSLSSIRSQPADELSAASTVTVGFALQKSDVLLSTVLSDKQSILQLLTVIASAVVSLFSLFAIAFRMAEHHLLRRLGWSSGPVAPPVAPATKRMRSDSDAETDEESARKPSTSPLPNSKSADDDAGATADADSGANPGANADAPCGDEPSLRVVTSPNSADQGADTAAATSAAVESASTSLGETAEGGLALASPSGATAAETAGATVYLRLSSPSATSAAHRSGAGSALSPSHLKYEPTAMPSPRPPTAPGKVRLHALPPLRSRAGLTSAPAGTSGSGLGLGPLPPVQVDVPGTVQV